VLLRGLQGNRTPYTDALSRGALSGLTLAHTRGHVFRAVLEGVAKGTRLILDTMAQAGYRPDSITIAGGAARSPLWLQVSEDTHT
jgi:sugar (pentulose or hexulose) kinase